MQIPVTLIFSTLDLNYSYPNTKLRVEKSRKERVCRMYMQENRRLTHVGKDIAFKELNIP